MLSPKEYYQNLALEKKGYYTGQSKEIQDQKEAPHSLSDVLMWKAQRKMQNRKYPGEHPVGSMRKEAYK